MHHFAGDAPFETAGKLLEELRSRSLPLHERRPYVEILAGLELQRSYREAQPDPITRFTPLLEQLVERVGSNREAMLFSSPGRTELGGNHTDHNNGQVLCASVSLDTIAAVAPRQDAVIRLASEGFAQPFELSCGDTKPRAEERETPTALIKGVTAALHEAGWTVGGFDAEVASAVTPGSGLSSSAAFEMLIAGIHNRLFNHDAIDPVTMAQAGRRAENEWFGKPCGLMDQLACAHGGIIAIDFADPQTPRIKPIEAGLAAGGHVLCIAHPGGDHAELTHDYAAVPNEMQAIARELGGTTLRDVTAEEVLQQLEPLRRRHGDRAALRALHFFDENQRVAQQYDALARGDSDAYLRAVRKSGISSWTLLQNYAPTGETQNQPIALAVALTERLGGESAVARVHGGGFAGSVQAYVPANRFDSYLGEMARVFGEGSVVPLQIRSWGPIRVA